MNNRAVFYTLLVVFIALSCVAGFKYYKSISGKKILNTSINSAYVEPVIGLYNRNNKDEEIKADDFHHIVLNITESTSDEEVQRSLATLSDTKLNLITIKTFANDESNVLQRTVDGNFDSKIKNICSALAKVNQPVYLRWNPEMEVPVTLYPWQYNSPILYSEAFRQFSKFSKKLLPNATIVWGPAGYPGSEEYWPGNDVVDLITLTINSKSELQATGYPPVQDMTVSLKRKIHRMRFMDKPILILGAEDTNANTLAKQFLPNAIREIQREQSTIYATVGSKPSLAKPVATINSKPIIGVYDPKQQLIRTKPVEVEHLFVNLGNIEEGVFLKEFTAITARKHDIILTVEPWRSKNYKEGDNVLLNAINGEYDPIFKKLYSILAATNQTVYLRFAHEMEIPIERYAWQSKDPVLYIKAFRYFMNYSSPKLKNVKRIWGPAGDRGSVEWWPGSDVVDYVSIAIYGLPDKNITDPKKQESFSTIYTRKHHRMYFADKPIFVTEFGVKGPEDLQMKWLEDAANVINQHPEIVGACYFNLADNPKAWGKIPAPDWSISHDTFISFSKKLISRQ